MYKLISGDIVIDLSYGDGKSRFVPIDHEEYKKWLSEGNTPEPIDAPTPEQLLANLKAVKNKAVADKLALHQYDSLATVKLWADDIDYGTEATALLEWYKNVTKMSITLENDVKAGTKPIPTEVEYQAMIDAVI